MQDVGGRRPHSLRSIRGMVKRFYPKLAFFIPAFVRVPKWLLNLVYGKFGGMPVLPPNLARRLMEADEKAVAQLQKEGKKEQ